MSNTIKLQIQLSELRSKLRKLSDTDVETPELRSQYDSLQEQVEQTEIKLRASLLADAQQASNIEQRGRLVDPALSEREELRKQCNLSAYLVAYKRGKLSGAELEYREECGFGDGHIPLSLFDSPIEDRTVESRAITAAPSTTGINAQDLVPFVFSASVASLLGIEMPRVESGTHQETRISGSLSPTWEAVGGDVEATAATFTQVSSTPHRIGCALEVAAETLASTGITNFEAALRANLQMSLSNSLDIAMLRGTGADEQISGLITNLTAVTAETTTSTWSSVLGKIAGLIDGIWCRSLADANVLLGTDSHKKFCQLFPASMDAAYPRQSLDDYLISKLGSLMSSAQMPAAASNVQTALACLKGAPGQRLSVCPQWGSIEISDIYSLSPKAQTRYLAHVLVGDCLVINPAAYKLLSFKLA